ncbi:hypothetical protein [Bradyrhizobium sp. USDA 4452]
MGIRRHWVCLNGEPHQSWRHVKLTQIASFVLELDRSEQAGAHGGLRPALQQSNASGRFVMAGRAAVSFVPLSRIGLLLVQQHRSHESSPIKKLLELGQLPALPERRGSYFHCGIFC